MTKLNGESSAVRSEESGVKLTEEVLVEVRTAEVFSAGEHVEIIVAVINGSHAPMLLNSRLLLNHRISEGELALSVRDDRGEEYRLQALVDPRDLEDGDFTIVKPGEALKKTFDLAQRFGVTKKGVYSVVAIYKNESEYSKNGLRAWRGMVTSSPKSIRLK